MNDSLNRLIMNLNLTNSTSNSTSYYDPYVVRDSIVLFMYLITSIVAVIGNIFICLVVYNKKQMRSTTYILIVSMAISDIIGGLTIPGQWFFCSTWFLSIGSSGERICGLHKSAQILSYYVSTFTMTAIAIDRYRLVLHPLKPRIKWVWPVAITWLLGMLFTSTTLASMRVSEYFSPTQGLIGCRVIFAHDVSFILRKIRVLLVMSTQYIIPLGITAFLYGMVMYTIWKRETVGSVTQDKKQSLDKHKRKTIKMLIVVVVLFALAWLPTHIMHFLKFYTNIIPLEKGKCNSSTFYTLCYWLGISSCSYNVFIYCYFNSDFRLEAIRYWNMIFPFWKITAKDQNKKNDENASGATNATETSEKMDQTQV